MVADRETSEVDCMRDGESVRGLRIHSLGACLFFVAGQYSLERLSGGTLVSPIPENLLISVVLLLASFPFSSKKSAVTYRHRMVALVAFVAWSLASALRGPINDGVLEAAVNISAMFMLTLSITVVAARNPRYYAIEFLRWLFLAGLLFALAGFMFSSAGSRFSAFGGGPNVYARITGTGAIAGAYLVASRKIHRLSLFAIPVMVATCILSGSRGGMLGLTGAIFIVVLSGGIKGRRLKNAAVLGGMALIGAAVFWTQIRNVLAVRWLELTFERGYSSGRDEILAPAIEMFLTRPLSGHGLHAFETQYGLYTGHGYPHNLFVQVGSELGIVGLGLLLLLLLIWVFSRPLGRNDSLATTLNALAGFYLIVGQFSGDYYDNRGLFVFVALALLVRRSGLSVPFSEMHKNSHFRGSPQFGRSSNVNAPISRRPLA